MSHGVSGAGDGAAIFWPGQHRVIAVPTSLIERVLITECVYRVVIGLPLYPGTGWASLTAQLYPLPLIGVGAGGKGGGATAPPTF